jgi:hypothetical protein
VRDDLNAKNWYNHHNQPIKNNHFFDPWQCIIELEANLILKIKPPRFLNFEMLLPKLKSHPKEGRKKKNTNTFAHNLLLVQLLNYIPTYAVSVW